MPQTDKPIEPLTPDEVKGVAYWAGQELLAERDRVRQTEVPDGFEQIVPFAGADGNPLKLRQGPNLVENGYSMDEGKRALISISMPQATAPDVPPSQPMKNFLSAHGIEAKHTKVGIDAFSDSYYVEMDVAPEQWPRAKELLNNLLSKDDPGLSAVDIAKAKAAGRPAGMSTTEDQREALAAIASGDQEQISQVSKRIFSNDFDERLALSMKEMQQQPESNISPGRYAAMEKQRANNREWFDGKEEPLHDPTSIPKEFRESSSELGYTSLSEAGPNDSFVATSAEAASIRAYLKSSKSQVTEPHVGTTPMNEPHVGPGVTGLANAAGNLMQSASVLADPNASKEQKITAGVQGGLGVAQTGLEFAGPSFTNTAVEKPNWTGIGQGAQGEVTALGRVGGGLGIAGGGFGVVTSTMGLKDAYEKGDKIGMAMNTGNLVSNMAFTVSGVAQLLGDASVAADSSGVGLAIGIPLQTVANGLQVYDNHVQYQGMMQELKGRQADETFRSQGNILPGYNYIPGLPVAPNINEYKGLSNLNSEAGANNIVQRHANEPEKLDKLAHIHTDDYDKNVNARQEELDFQSHFLNSSTLGKYIYGGADRMKQSNETIRKLDTMIEAGVSGRAALEELHAGAPDEKGSKMAGYTWRMEEYQKRLAPLENDYKEQSEQVKRLAENYKTIRLSQFSDGEEKATALSSELAQKNLMEEREKVEKMSPEEQQTYFSKNKEFVEKAGITGRSDLKYVGLSSSQEEYNAKATMVDTTTQRGAEEKQAVEKTPDKQTPSPDKRSEVAPPDSSMSKAFAAADALKSQGLLASNISGGHDISNQQSVQLSSPTIGKEQSPSGPNLAA